MHAPASKVLLGTASYNEAQALKRKLEAHQLDVVLIHNQQTCGGGCSVKLEIWANSTDAATIAQVLAREHQELLASMGYDPKLASEVYDSSRTEATCPCCGTSFQTTRSDCPECGLCFSVPDEPVKKGCGTC